MNAIQKKQVQLLMQDEKFNALMALYLEISDKWKDEFSKKENEFETIYSFAYTRGKLDGLKLYFDELEHQAS